MGRVLSGAVLSHLFAGDPLAVPVPSGSLLLLGLASYVLHARGPTASAAPSAPLATA